MTETDKKKLEKLKKQYKKLEIFRIFLICCYGVLVVLVFLAMGEVINLPFYNYMSPKAYITICLAIPVFWMSRKKRKVKYQIKELESLGLNTGDDGTKDNTR